jgi:hypothetical protein
LSLNLLFNVRLLLRWRFRYLRVFFIVFNLTFLCS